jgi:sulfur-oxidizing protein SoxB
LDAGRTYRVAGWASVNEQQGKPVWDIVGDYLRERPQLRLPRDTSVAITGVEGNPGYGGAA